jgi:hypothetical protein
MKRLLHLAGAVALVVPLLALFPATSHAATCVAADTAQGTANGAGSSPTISTAATGRWPVGDVVLAAVEWHDSPGSEQGAPPGWNPAYPAGVQTAGGGWGTYSSEVFWHIAAAGDTSVTFTLSGAVPWTVILTSYSGADKSYPFDPAASSGTSGTANQVSTAEPQDSAAVSKDCSLGYSAMFAEDGDTTGQASTMPESDTGQTSVTSQVSGSEPAGGYVVGSVFVSTHLDAGSTFDMPVFRATEAGSTDPILQNFIWHVGVLTPARHYG